MPGKETTDVSDERWKWLFLPLAGSGVANVALSDFATFALNYTGAQ